MEKERAVRQIVKGGKRRLSILYKKKGSAREPSLSRARARARSRVASTRARACRRVKDQVRARACVHVLARVCVLSGAYVLPGVRLCVRASWHSSLGSCVRACLRACLLACVRVPARPRVLRERRRLVGHWSDSRCPCRHARWHRPSDRRRLPRWWTGRIRR